MTSKRFFTLCLSLSLAIPLMAPSAVYAVENTQEAAAGLFDEIKEKYDGLESNYGNIEVVNKDEIYQDYLNNIKASNESMKIQESIDKINNFDYTSNNNEYISKIWNSAKDEAGTVKKDAEALQEAFEKKYAAAAAKAKAEAEAAKAAGKAEAAEVMNKYNAQSANISAKQAQIEQERIAAAATRYNTVASGYYDAVAKTQATMAGLKTHVDPPKFDDVKLEDIASILGFHSTWVDELTGSTVTGSTVLKPKNLVNSTKTANETKKNTQVYSSNASK